ncbi:DUF421 domain-containing protein [Acuticoccus sp. M5D2P5]|uniref:DUF421 domain-containing protein n=1 Tax=Acuticoccus kalidii TaxID=2910977 RepID=UPI001F163D6D|nr:YetF domain-containing protein [Acuticoccus kalidii]MCF3936019.1 DUF421 domain-containing protein [Acuticoccus kalidii]
MVDLYLDAARPVQVAIATILSFALLVLLLRISGKRTLTDLNAFDFVVTVALGSVLATTILSPSVALVDGFTALVALVVCQAVVASIAVRSESARRAIKSEPTLLVRNGRLLTSAMRRERLTEADILSAIRAAGQASLDEVTAVVLETNGELSVIENRPPEGEAALAAARRDGV